MSEIVFPKTKQELLDAWAEGKAAATTAEQREAWLTLEVDRIQEFKDCSEEDAVNPFDPGWTVLDKLRALKQNLTGGAV